MINKFEDECKDEQYADLEQFKRAMFKFTKDENDIADFWSRYNIDGKYFLRL